MRQAGRYLPEYCETRKRAGSFLNLCKSPAMACEVTLQPLARYDLDAAILFSDILTVPDAMGLGLYFAEGEGPKFERPLNEEWAIRDLTAPDPDHLRYVMDGVSEIRRALDNSVPLIGFTGSPWTLACYMVEGRSSGRLPQGQDDDVRPSRPHAPHPLGDDRCRRRLPQRPDRLRRPGRDDLRLLGRCAVGSGLSGILAGLHEEDRRRPEEGKGRRKIPSIVFTKAAACGWNRSPIPAATGIGLDWTIDIGEARRRVGDRVALQGNLDPNVLFASRKPRAARSAKVLEALAPRPPATSSTSAMASRNSRRRTASRRSGRYRVHAYSRELRKKSAFEARFFGFWCLTYAFQNLRPPCGGRGKGSVNQRRFIKLLIFNI